MTVPRTVLGDAEVLHALKSGGMGDVLLARRRGPAGFEQLCAIKTIRGELAGAPLAREMFLDEARLLARLTHPGIAQIFDVGDQDGTLYMIMEYVPGFHFRRFGERRPPPAIVCAAMAAACRGLHAAHELRDLGDGHLLGVVHRDISPDNLMLGFDARVKVLDFGIALVKGRQAPVTELGVLKGKPPYMSPEQIKNQALDRRSDVFSCCAVLHELLAGQVLFQGDSLYAVARAVEHQVIEPPSKWAGRLPDDLDDVVMAGLERDHGRRLASAAALAEVLERIAAAHATESLEAWTERVLADEREQHRVWLARILAASGPMHAVGRPTGTVTAIDGRRAPLPPGTEETLPSAPTQPPAPVYSTQYANRVSATRIGGARPTRGQARWIIALLAIIAVLAGTRFTLQACRRRARMLAAVDAPARSADAAVALPLDAAEVDAAPPDDAPADAPIDGAERRRRDAGERPVDAAPASRPPVDAPAPAVDAAPSGEGFITFTPKPYAVVSVDGVDLGASPLYNKRFPAGRHEIVFTHPIDGTVILRKVVDLQPGQKLTIR